MAKKTPKKKISSKKRLQHITTIKYMYIGLVALVILFAGKAIFSATTKIHVLGASTGPTLLADQGSDSGGSSGGDNGGGGSSSGGSGSNTGSGSSGPSGSGGSIGSGPSGSVPASPTTGINNQAGSSGVLNTSMSGSTIVDCVGPDGKHFTTTFADCQELNQKWGRSTFMFTQLDGSSHTEKDQTITSDSGQSSGEVQVEGNKGEFNLQTQNAHIEIKQEDNGQVSIHAQEENGTEVSLKDNSLEEINKLMENQGIEVSSDSAHGLSLISGGVHANTNFPLSFDPTTKTLSITTPNGTRTISVLPDQAVSAVLHSGIMTHVQSQSLGDQTATATANLTELNNQAVFEINGVAEKKLLGLFPVGFAKTTFVSASNSAILKTDESLLNRILESISF